MNQAPSDDAGCNHTMVRHHKIDPNLLEDILNHTESCYRQNAEDDNRRLKAWCMVCSDAAAEVRLWPCQHVCVCRACYYKQPPDECPECKAYVESAVVIATVERKVPLSDADFDDRMSLVERVITNTKQSLTEDEVIALRPDLWMCGNE